jgi:hypothetical protein
MTDLNEHSFGLLIAYLLPGFLAVLVLADSSPTLAAWLASPPDASPTVAGFLYVTMASVALGITASTFRWLLIDTLHHHTGLRPPEWTFRYFHKHVDAFAGIVENHYRYYQFYGNTVVVILLGLATGHGVTHALGFAGALGLVAEFALLILFLAASRDALSKYHARATMFLASSTSGKD